MKHVGTQAAAKDVVTQDQLAAAGVAIVTHAATSKTTPVDADELPLADSAASWALKKLTWANLKATLLTFMLGNFRERLGSARTYYVRTDGSDGNTGLANSSGGAFLTIQKAADVVAGLDLNSYPVTIQVADGTYADPTIFRSVFGGAVTVTGNAAAPDNVLVSPSEGTCFTVDNCDVTVANMKLQTSGVAGFTSSAAGRIIGTNITFGACGYAHVAAVTGGRVILSGNIRIVGGAPSFSNLDEGNLDVTLVSFTLTGTPAFSFFIYAINASYARVVQPTFSGSATGVRYAASLNSVINVFGAGATFLPGNAAGSTATGGQYA